MTIRATVEVKKGERVVAVRRSEWVKVPESLSIDAAAQIALGPVAAQLRREAMQADAPHRRD